MPFLCLTSCLIHLQLLFKNKLDSECGWLNFNHQILTDVLPIICSVLSGDNQLWQICQILNVTQLCPVGSNHFRFCHSAPAHQLSFVSLSPGLCWKCWFKQKQWCVKHPLLLYKLLTKRKFTPKPVEHCFKEPCLSALKLQQNESYHFHTGQPPLYTAAPV